MGTVADLRSFRAVFESINVSAKFKRLIFCDFGASPKLAIFPPGLSSGENIASSAVNSLTESMVGNDFLHVVERVGHRDVLPPAAAHHAAALQVVEQGYE